jgi:hypothetical protein
MKQGTRQAPPRANAMLESLRGLGYSPGAALADIIDNSISAQATEVAIDFHWSGKRSSITITDDGCGMSDPDLECAMRLGDKSPLDDRASTDLGRFGMGLKTASFSQCRRLTVASKKADVVSCLRWDLDALATDPASEWTLFEGAAPGSEDLFKGLSKVASGTVVAWELLDRIVTEGYTADDFLSLVDEVERHLSMVFHRLLQGPRARLRITLNGHDVKPWDPFMAGHPAKLWSSPLSRKATPYGTVEAQCHVLPHRDKLSAAEFDANAGPNGWTAQQGFYVYRNERLLLAGGWLGLGHGRSWNREEPHRLARIRLDIPNTADTEWKIDVRKLTARPPVALRPWLIALADHTREQARKVFAYRGSPNAPSGFQPIEQAWKIDRTKEGIRYRVDQKHPMVAAVLESVGDQRRLILAMLRVIEETVPVQRIWLDTAENKETPLTGFSGEPLQEVVNVLSTLFRDMVDRKGMSQEIARKSLLAIEPFQNYPDLVAGLR